MNQFTYVLNIVKIIFECFDKSRMEIFGEVFCFSYCVSYLIKIDKRFERAKLHCKAYDAIERNATATHLHSNFVEITPEGAEAK